MAGCTWTSPEAWPEMGEKTRRNVCCWRLSKESTNGGRTNGQCQIWQRGKGDGSEAASGANTLRPLVDISGGCSSGAMQTETRLEEAKGTITRLAMEMAIKGILRRIRMKSGERKKQLWVVEGCGGLWRPPYLLNQDWRDSNMSKWWRERIISKDTFQSLCKGTGPGKGARPTHLCCNGRRGQESADLGTFVGLVGGRFKCSCFLGFKGGGGICWES